MDIRQAAKYPFLKDSAKVLRDRGIELDHLVKGLAYESARLQGMERILEIIENPIIETKTTAKEPDALKELLSYPVARMIASAVADPKLVNRYAIAEAKTASRRLEQEEVEFVLAVAKELGIEASQVDDGFAVEFTDFLTFSSKMRSKDWKLVNQKLLKGKVIVQKRDLVRLVQQAVADKISSELPLPVNDEILDAFSEQIAEVKSILEEERKSRPAEDMGRLSIVRLPPCMKKLLQMTRESQNVPHSGRFALVAFLHTLGMDSEEILRTFSTSPDFDEGKSRYQIQHISGEISGTEYTPPECSTMKSYGICFDPDNLCRQEWMTHPLKYYRAKGRRRPSGK